MSAYNLKQIIFNCSLENFRLLTKYVEDAQKRFRSPTLCGWKEDLALERLTGKCGNGIHTSLSINLKTEHKQPQLFAWIEERRLAEQEKATRIAEEADRQHRIEKILERKAKPFEQRVIEWRKAKRKRVEAYEKKQRLWNDAPSVYFSTFIDLDENWNPIYTLKVGRSNKHPTTRTKNWGKLIVSIPYACETNVHTWLKRRLPQITLGHGREGGTELFGSFEDGMQLYEAGKFFAELYAQEHDMKVRYG